MVSVVDEGVSLELNRPVFRGETIRPLHIMIEHRWLDKFRQAGVDPQRSAAELVDELGVALSKLAGQGPPGLVVLAGRPSPTTPDPKQASNPAHFDL